MSLDTAEEIRTACAPVVLIVEDDELVQTMLVDALTEAGFESATASSGEEALTLLQSGAFLKDSAVIYHALVTDIHLKGAIDGWKVAEAAREIDAKFPIV